MVRVKDFPALKLIAWSYKEDVELTDEEALALYERNWRFVDQARLSSEERALIERLVREVGGGILHV